MFGRQQEPQIKDDDFGNSTMSLSQYRSYVNLGLSESEEDLEAARQSGHALRVQDAEEELDRWRDKREFANCVEGNPDTPVRWRGR